MLDFMLMVIAVIIGGIFGSAVVIMVSDFFSKPKKMEFKTTENPETVLESKRLSDMLDEMLVESKNDSKNLK